MSGFEFEEFFGHLLSKLGRGQVEKILFTHDEGRDILVRTTTGLVVVECKHHPNGSIGRPIVQKLHSAVISSGAAGGILVTTGHFTKEALDYARKISPRVEMIDRALLTEMAARAGIRMISKGETLSVWTLSIPDEKVIKTSLGKYLDTALDGYPRAPGSMLTDVQRRVRYRPIYLVTYDVNAVFATTVGVIHTERAHQAKLAFDGVSGELLDKVITDFILPEPQTQLLGVSKELSRELPSFRLDGVTALGRAKDMISQIHSRTVSYYGRNNRRYRKLCEPAEHDIFIADIRQMHFPSLELEFRVLDTQYHAAVLQGPSGRLLPRSDNLSECRICESRIRGKTLVCDTCGRVTHGKRLFATRSHGFRCMNCKRTTCRRDGRWVFRWLLFYKLLCSVCALEITKRGRKVYAFKPLSESRTSSKKA